MRGELLQEDLSGAAARQQSAATLAVCGCAERRVGVLTLSTSLVKGLVEFQLHHFLCSCGSGGRKSWKVRTLHALGRALAPPSAADLGEAESGDEGQSPVGAGPVSLCRRKRSRC